MKLYSKLEIYHHCYHCHWCKGNRDNKVEKQLLIANGEGEFDQDVFAFGNNFRIEYDQLFEAYNEGQCVMLLIKNVTTTSKGN